MNPDTFLKHIRALIARDELEQALQQLQQFLAHSPQLEEALHQSGRFAAIRKQIRLGTVSQAEAALTQNQIRAALLEMLSEIDTQQAESPALVTEAARAISILQSKNVVAGSTISGQSVHIGDKQFINPNTQGILLAIEEILRRPKLPHKNRHDLENWVKQLNQPDAALFANEILHKFSKLRATLDNLDTQNHDKLKIWLNRHQQRQAFGGQLKAFCKKADKVSPFLFCVCGQAEEDGLADAAEMLLHHYLDDLMKVGHSPDFSRKGLVNDALILTDERQSVDACDTILRGVLDMDFFAERTDFLDALEHKHQQQHIIIRGRVRSWQEAGLLAFFQEWSAAFERHPRYPFVLLLEFSAADYDALDILLSHEFTDCSIALLPPLGEVEEQDVADFYDRPLKLPGYNRYEDIFDRNSLTAADAPLRYRPAINKLKRKA